MRIFNLSVIKFKVIMIKRLENQETVIHGKVARIFKHSNVTIHNGRIMIWSNTNIACPSLRAGKAFLICSHESPSRQKLLLSSSSLIVAWSRQTFKTIRKWRKLERKMDIKIKARNWAHCSDMKGIVCWYFKNKVCCPKVGYVRQWRITLNILCHFPQ